MQITPNDVGASKGLSNSLDPKVLQLINTFANKPLLIEKLLLSHSQGVLLKLAFNTKQLDLQLPIKTTPLFKNISQNSVKLTLSVNNQQQVQLQLNQMISSRANSPLTQPIIFQTSQLLPGQILQLDNPKPHPSMLRKSVNTDVNFAATKQSKLDNSQLANAKPPSIENSQQKQRLQMPDSQIAASRPGSSARLLTTPPPQSSTQTSRSVPTSQISEEKITVANAAKLILKSHFSKQLPIATHLTNISRIANILSKQPPSSPLEIKLQKQIKQLMEIIQKPVKHSAGEIKQRVENSGHLLEKNLAKQMRQVETSANQPVKTDRQNKIATGYPKTELLIKQKGGENSKVDKQTSIPKANAKTLTATSQANDIKLQLMKIRSTLETIVNPAKQSKSNQSQPPVTTPSSPSPETKPIAAQQQPTNTAGRSAIQAKAQLFIQQQMLVKQATKLLTEVKNIVSQIESNQLLSLKNEVPNLHQFLLDLPLRNNSDIDSFEMLFEHSETNKAGQKVKRWKVVVRFDLAPLGPMFAQIELENERISTHFFAQSEQTAQLINQYLPLLKKSLFTAGVDIDKLGGSQGKIPERLLNDDEQLIDTHA